MSNLPTRRERQAPTFWCKVTLGEPRGLPALSWASVWAAGAELCQVCLDREESNAAAGGLISAQPSRRERGVSQGEREGDAAGGTLCPAGAVLCQERFSVDGAASSEQDSKR